MVGDFDRAQVRQRWVTGTAERITSVPSIACT